MSPTKSPQGTPPGRRAAQSIDPLRKRLDRLRGELQAELLAGRNTAGVRVAIKGAERDLAAAQRALDDDLQRAAAEIDALHAEEAEEADAAWRRELAEFIGTMPPAPAARA